MAERELQSDDLELKAAERAPADLRERMAALLAQTPAEKGGEPAPLPEQLPRRQTRSASPFNRRSLLIYGLSAAVLIAVGITFNPWATKPDRYSASIKLSETLTTAMATAHDRNLTAGAHAYGPASGTVPGIGGQLAQKLGRPVLAADLAADGWTFQGAGVCTIDQHQAGYLLFTKPGKSLSLVSLPHAALPAGAKEGGNYVVSVNEHQLAGFVKNGNLYCAIGYSPEGKLQPYEVRELLQKIRSDLVPTL